MNTKDQKNAHQQSFENSTQESPNFSPLSQMNPMFSQIQPWNPSTFYPKRPEFVCFMHGFYAVIGGFVFGFISPFLLGKYGLFGGFSSVNPDLLLPVYGPKLPWKQRLHYTYLIPNLRLSFKKARQQSKEVAREIVSMGWTQSKMFAKVGLFFALSECFIERWRAKTDMWNALLGGCLAGVVFAGSLKPRAIFHSVVAFSVLGLIFEALFRANEYMLDSLPTELNMEKEMS